MSPIERGPARELLESIDGKVTSLASGAGSLRFFPFGPNSVDVDNLALQGLTLVKADGNIVSTAEITSVGTHTIKRRRGGSTSTIVSATANSESAGRVYVEYTYASANWAIDDGFEVVFSGVVVTIGGEAFNYTDIPILGLIVDSSAINALVTSTNDTVTHVTYGNSVLQTELAAVQTSVDNLNDVSTAEVNTEVDNGLDTAVPEPPTPNALTDTLHKDGSYTFDNTTDSLEAISDAVGAISTVSVSAAPNITGRYIGPSNINRSFNTTTVGWDAPVAGETLTWDGAEGHEALGAAKIVSSGSGAQLENSVDAGSYPAGTVLFFSAWVKSDVSGTSFFLIGSAPNLTTQVGITGSVSAGTWTRITGTLELTTDFFSAFFFGLKHLAGSANTTYFDDFEVTAMDDNLIERFDDVDDDNTTIITSTTAIQANTDLMLDGAVELTVNGDMELNSDWDDLGTPTTSEQSSEQAHGGTYSWKIISDASNEGIVQNMVSGTLVTAGAPAHKQMTVISAFVYTAQASSSVQLRLRWGTVFSESFELTQNSWNRISMIVRPELPLSGTNYQISVMSAASGQTFYIDDISARVLNTPIMDGFSDVKDDIADVSTSIAALNDVSTAEVNTQADLALNTAVPEPPTANALTDTLHKDGSYTYDNTTDSLEALADHQTEIDTRQWDRTTGASTSLALSGSFTDLINTETSTDGIFMGGWMYVASGTLNSSNNIQIEVLTDVVGGTAKIVSQKTYTSLPYVEVIPIPDDGTGFPAPFNTANTFQVRAKTNGTISIRYRIILYSRRS